jgi:hypothetical protein
LAGCIATWSPRRPADTYIVGSLVAEASTAIGSRVRWPNGEMPPVT